MILLNKESLIGAPCISVQQPWPWAMFYANKDIENRDWLTTFRGKILIHAGKRIDKDSYSFIERLSGLTIPKDLPTGGVVGMVEIVDCVKTSTSKWFFGKCGFVLKNQRETQFIPYRGQLGIFRITKEGLGL